LPWTFSLNLHTDTSASQPGRATPFLLGACNRAELADHLLLLPEEQRYTRFIGTMSDEAIAGFVARLDFDKELLAGLRGDDGDLRGVVQSSYDSKGAWELAFSTSPAFQRRGIATLLGRWMLGHVTGLGAREACIYCAPKNVAMRGLARKLGFTVRVEDGEVIAQRRLDGSLPAGA
jgi:RimJ/RimL family protein N-acetyltransferase